ncbi:MAG: hypothetical protein H0U04_08220 [Rubrobacter sp.]|nr:hypothetical protein [Rubrobacter sp.]
MKVMVLGGNGYCGWPTSLYLSDQGHEVIIVDNFVRRTIDPELSASSLTPIMGLKERVKAWVAPAEYRDKVDAEVVMPSVTWKSGKARQRVNKAPAQPSAH